MLLAFVAHAATMMLVEWRRRASRYRLHGREVIREQLPRELEPELYVSEEAAREAVRLRRLFNAIHLATGLKVVRPVPDQDGHADRGMGG